MDLGLLDREGKISKRKGPNSRLAVAGSNKLSGGG